MKTDALRFDQYEQERETIGVFQAGEACHGSLDIFVDKSHELLESGNIKAAEKCCTQGLAVAQAAIPEGFPGIIPWRHLENRPFLYLHYTLILCHIKAGRHKKAVQSMEQHLALNPNDNIGIRYLIGDAYIQAGLPGKAKKILSEIRKEFPPAAYSLALLFFKKGKYIEAATAMRLGILQNPYIAEALTGRTHLSPRLYWHGTNLAAPETAVLYLENSGRDIWMSTPGAVDFCDWLFNHSAILKERAAMASAMEGLTTEWNFEQRGQYVDLQTKIISSIDNRLSKKIIRKFTDRSGEEKWPWCCEKYKEFVFD
ncbi:MAG: tetratricopeptide repeat protein [Desulfotignum sp.]|nr:tetratricopeptide repeat protein [Desulfotignum sp.]